MELAHVPHINQQLEGGIVLSFFELNLNCVQVNEIKFTLNLNHFRSQFRRLNENHDTWLRVDKLEYLINIFLVLLNLCCKLWVLSNHLSACSCRKGAASLIGNTCRPLLFRLLALLRLEVTIVHALVDLISVRNERVVVQHTLIPGRSPLAATGRAPC